MRYYILRMLSLLKLALGELMSKIASIYNKLGNIISEGVLLEEQKIKELQQKNVDKAKELVVVAAKVVLEAEKNVSVVEEKEAIKAHDKLVKLNTKVQ